MTTRTQSNAVIGLFAVAILCLYAVNHTRSSDPDASEITDYEIGEGDRIVPTTVDATKDKQAFYKGVDVFLRSKSKVSANFPAPFRVEVSAA